VSVITVDNLGKSYRVGHRTGERYIALRDVIAQAAYNTVRKTGDLLRGRAIVDGDEIEEFWALRNVSFAVEQGEAIGIIGRNGAGKSTLLKILSRITEPSEGQARIRGRVASLLEVGTGFHPELTGRENIYLNGAILGMKRAEIRRRFDEIVAFAEVEQFLDTPVKRYSSGMYMRLAFAVAAHLEPDILVVDEVLAVGDAAFQKKCLGKMSDVTQGGRTVLFVSHNLGAVNALCGRCLLLEHGRVAACGSVEAVTRRYLGQEKQSPASVTFEPRGVASLLSVGLQDRAGTPANVFDMRHPIWVRLEFRLAQRIAGLQVAIAVFDGKGERIFYHSNAYAEPSRMVDDAGVHTLYARLPEMFLVPGRYSINAALLIPNVEIYDLRESAVAFEVEDGGSGRHEFGWNGMGCVLANVEWQFAPHQA
jgi:lipopolysaccharide transport system ATP-binding protein